MTLLAVALALACVGPPARAAPPSSAWTLYTVVGGGRSTHTPREGDVASLAALTPASVVGLLDGGFAMAGYDDDRAWMVTPAGRLHLVATLHRLTDLTPTADGGWLLSGVYDVQRVRPDGTTVRIAGTGRDGRSPDGTAALDAAIAPWGLQALAGGGFIFIDSGPRIREVGPDGLLRTVAGGGRRAPGRSPVPATSIRIENAYDFALLPDGSMLILDWGRSAVVRVDAAGMATAFMRDIGYLNSGSALAGGDALVSVTPVLDALYGPYFFDGTPHGGTVWTVSPDGRTRTIAGDYCRNRQWPFLPGRGNDIFNGAGRPARCARLGAGRLDVSTTAYGDVLVASTDSARVQVLAAPGTRTPAAAITSASVSRERLSVAFTTTLSGTAELTAYRGTRGTAVASHAAPVAAGPVSVAGHFAPGVHRLRLVVTAPDGRVARSEIGVLVGRLTPRIARGAVGRFGREYGWQSPGFGACHRFSSARIDCERRFGHGRCQEIDAITLARSGLVGFRPYGCGKPASRRFRLHPRWLTYLGSWPPFHRPGLAPAPLLAAH